MQTHWREVQDRHGEELAARAPQERNQGSRTMLADIASLIRVQYADEGIDGLQAPTEEDRVRVEEHQRQEEQQRREERRRQRRRQHNEEARLRREEAQR